MANSNEQDNLHSLSRHPVYYIPTADLSILVEHIQFRVHKFFFERESQYFANQLAASPVTPGFPLQGSGDGHAIVLEDLTADEFAQFLWVFYNPRYSIYEATVEQWETILRLATRWAFPEVKDLSVRELEKKDMLDVKRIKLYHENKVDRNYLIPRYAALCLRDEPLTLEEGMDLGMATALVIARGREEVRASRTASGARSPLTPTIHGTDLHEVVRDLFKITPAGAAETEAQTSSVTALATPQTKTPPAPPPAVTSPTQPRPTSPLNQRKTQGSQQTSNKATKGNQGTGPQQQQRQHQQQTTDKAIAEDEVVNRGLGAKTEKTTTADTSTTAPSPPTLTETDPAIAKDANLFDFTADTGKTNSTASTHTPSIFDFDSSSVYPGTSSSTFGNYSTFDSMW